MNSETFGRPFGRFVTMLRQNGFDIGVEQHLQLYEFLDRNCASVSPGQLKLFLCPIFASSESEQQEFYRLFDTYFPQFTRTPEPETTTPTDSTASPRQPARSRKYFLVAIVVGVLILVPILIALFTRTSQRPEPVPAPVKPPIILVPDNHVEKPGPHLSLSHVLFGVALAAFALLGTELIYRIRRFALGGRGLPPLSPPLTLALKSPSADGHVNLFQRDEVRQIARSMRRRSLADTMSLNVRRTVLESIRSLGFLRLEYDRNTRPSEYLVLIERYGQNDHLAILYEDMIARLKMEGAIVSVWFLSPNLPMVSSADDRTQLSLQHLFERMPEHRVIVAAEATSMFDAFTGQLTDQASLLLRWDDRAFLTPNPPNDWGPFEFEVSKNFRLLPGKLGSIATFVERLDKEYKAAPRTAIGNRNKGIISSGSDGRTTTSLPSIYQYLGDRRFEFFSACAFFPELQWDLTCHLGKTVFPDVFNEDSLQRLFRLPWFRSGQMPVPFQQTLSSILPRNVRRLVRKEILSLLGRSEPPAHSVAAIDRQVELVVQEWSLEPRDRTAIKQDAAQTRIVVSTRASGIGLLLPRWVRRSIYRHGLPTLGLTDWALSITAGVLSGLLITQLTGSFLPAIFVASIVCMSLGLRDKATTELSALFATSAAPPVQYQDSLSRRFVHSGPITGVSFSPDGLYLATSSRDGTARLWEVTSGKETVSVSTYPYGLNDVEYSRDGRWIATAGKDGTARVWSAASGDLASVLAGHTGSVRKVSFSRSGKLLATAGADHSARIWHWSDNRTPIFVSEYERGISAIAFSPDDRLIVIGAEDGVISIWDVASKARLSTFKAHTQAVSCIKTSPDAFRFASASFDRTAAVWDIKSGAQIMSLKGHRDAVSHLAYTAAGTKLVTASLDRTVRLWDLSLGAPTRVFEYSAPVLCLTVAADSTNVASGKTDGSVTVTPLQAL